MLRQVGQIVENSHCGDPCEACYQQCDVPPEEKGKNLAIPGIKELAAFLFPDAFVVDEVVDVSSSIPTNQMAQAFPHLRKLSFPALEEKKLYLQ